MQVFLTSMVAGFKKYLEYNRGSCSRHVPFISFKLDWFPWLLKNVFHDTAIFEASRQVMLQNLNVSDCFHMICFVLNICDMNNT